MKSESLERNQEDLLAIIFDEEIIQDHPCPCMIRLDGSLLVF
jgi:hypothetical protein